MSQPAAPTYLDTSALAKWYLNEPGSDEFEAFIARRPGAIVSRLAAVELRCLPARRRRAGDIAPEIEEQRRGWARPVRERRRAGSSPLPHRTGQSEISSTAGFSRR